MIERAMAPFALASGHAKVSSDSVAVREPSCKPELGWVDLHQLAEMRPLEANLAVDDRLLMDISPF